jgi:hypothetical protein
MSKFLAAVLPILATLLIGVALGVFIIEYAAGCGETYTDANGVRHAHECVFFNK